VDDETKVIDLDEYVRAKALQEYREVIDAVWASPLLDEPISPQPDLMFLSPHMIDDIERAFGMVLDENGRFVKKPPELRVVEDLDDD